ncbi:hypothetical protein CDG62_09520 [Acinetobacter sp. WCHA55]|uniref:hypothetical protein n=1 Tax=Acinetobacter sp. WCHA55 TaxID=2004646 RepID=UPI000B3D4B46|nr:hypothetical protein [Acinetobacter sp. WCHA55]AYA68562.1 hypothetical protein CDG62_09520 [Acinetobacter sp. WCHA55]
MTVDDLKKHYGFKSDAELARKLKHTRGTICKWRYGGIPIDRQARLQLLTNGDVKASIAVFLA